MKNINNHKLVLRALVAAGTFAAMGLATSAHAQTSMNASGSSAGRLVAGAVGVNICDIGTTGDWPKRWATADNNQQAWECKRGGNSVIIRYFARGSSDGVEPLLLPASDTDESPNGSHLGFMILPPTGCGAVTHITGTGGREYDQQTGCSNATATTLLPVHLGASDVLGSSFGQTAPAGNTQPVLNDSTLNSQVVSYIPFTLALSKGVVRVNTAGTQVLGPVESLPQTAVEQLLQRTNLTDWRQIGLGTAAICTGVNTPHAGCTGVGAPPPAGATPDATSATTVCHRSAGSGTLATLDQTVMLNTPIPVVALPNIMIFNTSTSNMQTCLGTNNRTIGYLDADAISATASYYAVGIDGAKANDTTLADPKANIKCGKYGFTAGWRLNRRTTSEGAAIDDLRDAYVASAATASVINSLPNSGNFWVANSEMFATKNADKGPWIFVAGPHLATCGG